MEFRNPYFSRNCDILCYWYFNEKIMFLRPVDSVCYSVTPFWYFAAFAPPIIFKLIKINFSIAAYWRNYGNWWHGWRILSVIIIWWYVDQTKSSPTARSSQSFLITSSKFNLLSRYKSKFYHHVHCQKCVKNKKICKLLSSCLRINSKNH